MDPPDPKRVTRPRRLLVQSCPRYNRGPICIVALIYFANAVSGSIFEPASPLNIVPGKLESEVFESTDSEILRRDLFNEKWNVNNGKDTVYGGPGCQNTECIPSNRMTNTEIQILVNTKQGIFCQLNIINEI